MPETSVLLQAGAGALLQAGKCAGTAKSMSPWLVLPCPFMGLRDFCASFPIAGDGFAQTTITLENRCEAGGPSISASPSMAAAAEVSPLPDGHSDCSSFRDCCNLGIFCNRKVKCTCSEDGGACFTSTCGTSGCCRPWSNTTA